MMDFLFIACVVSVYVLPFLILTAILEVTIWKD